MTRQTSDWVFLGNNYIKTWAIPLLFQHLTLVHQSSCNHQVYAENKESLCLTKGVLTGSSFSKAKQ